MATSTAPVSDHTPAGRPPRRGGRPRFLAVSTVLAFTLALTAACGGSSDADAGSEPTTATATASVDTEAQALLPTDVRDAGVLSMVSPFTYPPYSFMDGTDMAGSDWEIGNEIAHRLGLEPEWTRLQSFDAIVPSVQNGRFDMTIDALADTPERRRLVTMVDYQQSVWGLLVAAGNPEGVDPDNICGLSMGGSPGSANLMATQTLSEECVANGEEPIQLTTYQTGDAPVAAVASGQITAFLDFTGHIRGVIAQQPDRLAELTPTGDIYPPSIHAIIVRPSAPGLARATEAVMKDMQDDGTVAAIYEKYDIPENTLFPADLVEESLQDAS